MGMAGALEQALADAGGAGAPRESSARLRELLRAELERGRDELERRRSGRRGPIAVVLAPGAQAVLAALPVAPELRADPDAVNDRAGRLAQATVAAMAEAADPGRRGAAEALQLELGEHEGFLAVSYPAADPRWTAEFARELLDDALASIDRLRASVHLVPGHVLEPRDLRAPLGATHPLRVAEAVARLGGSPLDEESVEALAPELERLLEPPGTVAPPHDDPDPRRRVMRRILQRLDGMGKWGGYHTAFDHLARGFAGNERARAYELGEELVAAGLLVEKTSVGQRHVSLNPRRVADIRALIDEGRLPPALVSSR
jgi:hypothetical protein